MMPRQQQDMRNGDQQKIDNFEATATTDDYYLEQMLASLPSWNEFTTHTKSGWDMKQQQAVQFDEESAIIMQQMNANNSGFERSIQGLYDGFAESLQSQQFLPSQKEVDPPPAPENNGSAPRQRVRARRGQATDPHSIAERVRRERIAERMKGLQELVPNANKTDKASMLDEIIDYVKFLQLQVKVLSVSRMGGAAALAPLVAGAERRDVIGIASGATSTDADASLTMAEQQVAKLMEEDMGSAMQYLQGKGLCLMPISLATAISTATSQSHSHSLPHNNKNIGNVKGMFLSNGNGPTSPTASVLTVQSSAFVNDSTSALG